MKVKENEKGQVLGSCRRTENATEHKVDVVVVGVLETVPKSSVKGLEVLKIGGRAEIIQITALLRILRRVLET